MGSSQTRTYVSLYVGALEVRHNRGREIKALSTFLLSGRADEVLPNRM